MNMLTKNFSKLIATMVLWSSNRDQHRGQHAENVPKFVVACLLLLVFVPTGCGVTERSADAANIGGVASLIGQILPASLSRLSVATVSLAVAVIIIIILTIPISKEESAVRKLVSQRFAYFMLICVFVTGFYGAITALLATSWLQTNVISDSQAESLVAKLANAEPPAPTTQINRILESFTDDPPRFDELTIKIRAFEDEDLRNVLSEWLSTEEAGFSRFMVAVETFKTQYLEVLEANNRLTTETGPNVLLDPAYGTRRRRSYQLGIESYQERMTKAIDAATETITADAKNINSGSRAAVQQMINTLERTKVRSEIQTTVGNTGFFRQQNRRLQSFERVAQNTVSGLTETILEPKEPDPLKDLGNLRYFVGWLIRPSSIDLLYIIGMVGFGILGSSLTTFVSASVRRLEDPNLKDVIAVVIKGTTAAMVVYLFIFGGFEVFSNADIVPFTPNVYMLFLTCFLGAVFSDRIWRYAELRLIKQLRSNRSSTQPPSQPDQINR